MKPALHFSQVFCPWLFNPNIFTRKKSVNDILKFKEDHAGNI